MNSQCAQKAAKKWGITDKETAQEAMRASLKAGAAAAKKLICASPEKVPANMRAWAAKTCAENAGAGAAQVTQ